MLKTSVFDLKFSSNQQVVKLINKVVESGRKW